MSLVSTVVSSGSSAASASWISVISGTETSVMVSSAALSCSSGSSPFSKGNTGLIPSGEPSTIFSNSGSGSASGSSGGTSSSTVSTCSGVLSSGTGISSFCISSCSAGSSSSAYAAAGNIEIHIASTRTIASHFLLFIFFVSSC